MNEEFDRWLERELRLLAANTPPPPDPRYARRRPRAAWRLRLASLPAALGTKLLVGAGAVALAGAGVGVKTVVTGNANPLDWSPTPQQVVQACMSPGAPSEGIGPCVRGQVIAGQAVAGHGQASASHGASGSAATPPTGQGARSSHPTPPASPGSSGDHPTPPVSPGGSGHPTPPPHPTPTAGGSSGSGGG